MRRGLLFLAWGTSTTLSFCALRQLGATDLLEVELLTGGVVIWVTTLLSARAELRTPRWPTYALLGICEPGLTYLLANEGLARDSASTASLLLAVLFLRERISRPLLAGLSLGLLGAIVVGSNAQPGRDTLAGHGFILASTFAAGTYGVLARRTAGQSPPLVVSAYQLLAEIVVALPLAVGTRLIGGPTLPHADMMHWAAGFAQSLDGVALPFVLYNRGIIAVRATVAAGVLNLIPFFGLISAVVVLRDHPTIVELIGGALVLCGIAWIGITETTTDGNHAVSQPTRREDRPVA